MILKQKNKTLILTLFSVALLSIFVFAGDSTHAESARYTTDVSPALRLTVPSGNIDITVDPSSKPFDSKDFTVTVDTNNLTGYSLSMNSDSTDLVKTNDSSKIMSTLSALDGGYTQDTFETNRWGYKIGNTNYIPFVSGVNIASSNAPVNNDSTTLNFAAKVDYVQPAGEYKTTLNFTAVANPGYLTIQNLDAAYCTSDPAIAIDARDGEEYWIQRLPDGNCWMLDNLRLDPVSTPLMVLKDNTNASDETLAYLKNGGGSGRYAREAVISEQENNFGSVVYDKPYVAVSKKNEVSEVAYGVGSGKKGVYYNFCAASAGSYCYTSDAGVGNATEDICPAGWRLPTGTGAEDWWKTVEEIYNYDKETMARDFSLNIVAGTYSFPNNSYNTSSPSQLWWASTVSQSNSMTQLEFTDSVFGDTHNFGINKVSGVRYNGQLTRCVLKDRDNETILDYEYMQDIKNPGVIERTEIGAITTLKDRTDGEEYVVGKLADGNLWMLDNYRLDLSTASVDSLTKYTNTWNADWLKNGREESEWWPTPLYPLVAKTADGGSWESSYNVPYINTAYKDTVISGTPGAGSGKIGVYYNFCAATGNGYCDRNSTGNTTYNICPKEWRLPTGGNDGEYKKLYDAYNNDDNAFKTALSVPLSGRYTGYDSDSNIGSIGYFWTGTQSSDVGMYGLRVTTAMVIPTSNEDRPYGHSIRCIWKK